MSISEHLSKPYEPEMQSMMDATPAGMAHWAGTGPDDAICGECNNFRPFNPVILEWGEAKKPYHKTRCMKASAMCRGNKMAAFSGRTPACRFFEARP